MGRVGRGWFPRSSFLRVIVITAIMANAAMASIFIFHDVFKITGSNSTLYVLKDWQGGGIEVKRDLFIEDADRLIFKVNLSGLFHSFIKGQAVARDKPVLELTWNEKEGVGDIKQFRPDGTELSLTFSRYVEDAGDVHGLFLGGDLPFADSDRSERQNTSGFGFYDGREWHHIWCASNEGFNIAGSDYAVVPPLWNFRGSRVLKDTTEEVILESDHDAVLGPYRIRMKRTASFRAGDDYFMLRVQFANTGDTPFSYNFAYGDEPWLGEFGSSAGDVGWYPGGLVRYEKFISPSRNSFAGFWDVGNDAAREGDGYSGYANFIQWLSPTPSFVFFSNDFENCCDEQQALNDGDNRVLNVVWHNRLLLPGEKRTHTLALGMAQPDPRTGLPRKPAVAL